MSCSGLGFYEFFAGAGLVRLGLGHQWRCLWANDIDPRKADVYMANFDKSEFLLGDVALVRASSLPIGSHLAWASFPCQDLSLAGWRQGMSGDRSGTFWAFWRIMRDLYDDERRPPIIVIENVVGLLHNRDDFQGLCEALASLGMQFGALVIDARLFLPHSRPRVFLIAVDSRLDCEAFSCNSPYSAPWFPKAILRAYQRLPSPLQQLWRWWRLPNPCLRIASVESLIQDEPDGVDWHTPDETERLLSMMSEPNLKKVRQAIALGYPCIGFVYRRVRQGQQRAEVRFDGIAGCLRTPRGGSSRQIVLVVEGERIRSRLLSPREAARLMGVPDTFWLPDNYNNAYFAMGDAVAVPVVAWLSEHLLVPLAHAVESGDGYTEEVTMCLTDEELNEYRSASEDLMAMWEAGRQ